MPFVPLYDLFPEIAVRETRVLTLSPGAPVPLPPGQYSFVELFCDEPNCDCRRVFLMVFLLPNMKKEALISWGWEDAAFYRQWLRADDLNAIEELQGPILDVGSPVTANAEALLDFVTNVLLADPAYVERIKKHYALFRSAIDSGIRPDRNRLKTGEASTGRGSESGEDAWTPARSGSTWANFSRSQQADSRQKVGRNDPCPCGSGKKFKHCCSK